MRKGAFLCLWSPGRCRHSCHFPLRALLSIHPVSEPEKSPRGIFDAALEIPDQKERATFVERECAGDAALLERVRELLLAFNDSETFMATKQPSPDSSRLDTVLSSPNHEPAGSVIGAFKATRRRQTNRNHRKLSHKEWAETWGPISIARRSIPRFIT